MEQIVKVRSLLPDGKARVVHVRQSACSGDCHKCAGCGAAEETLELTAENSIGAAPGDVVILESASAPVLRGAAVLYVLPILLFFAGYLLGTGFRAGALGGCAGFLAGMALAVLYDRKVAAQKQTVYTITGFAKP